MHVLALEAEGNKLPPIPAQRLDHELWPNRQQGGIGPIERRMRELGGVEALVVGAFAEHSADVHTLVDGLQNAGHLPDRESSGGPVAAWARPSRWAWAHSRALPVWRCLAKQN